MLFSNCGCRIFKGSLDYNSCVCAVWLRLQYLCLCCLVEITISVFVLFG